MPNIFFKHVFTDLENLKWEMPQTKKMGINVSVKLWVGDIVTLWVCDSVTLWVCDSVTLWVCDSVTHQTHSFTSKLL